MSVAIVGAGPAGLSAALTVAHAGQTAVVRERAFSVGHRFHGDFQGIENWTTRGDVLAEFASIGIDATFEHVPFYEATIFDRQGHEYTVRSPDPLWYLVRRGAAAGTLDDALRKQAVAAGVDLRFGEMVTHLPEGGVVAHGPHRADAVAVGYVFESDLADGAFGAVSDDLAPKGYAYLLVAGGRGTVATCLFDDFHQEKTYIQRTVDFFRERVGLRMSNPRSFGGSGNVYAERSARRGPLLFVGEAAGFQDALFGFGIRYAVLSGHLAASALLAGSPASYDLRWKERLGSLLSAGAVNRLLYEALGEAARSRLVRRIGTARDAREVLRRHYSPGIGHGVLRAIAGLRIARRRHLVMRCLEDCDCTWCRCARHGHATDATTLEENTT